MQRLPAGAAVGVVRNGRLVYAKGFGLRDVAAHKPVDAGTQFEIGSVSKQFTAAAILQLKEVKKLALDDALAKYLPSFPHARDVTLRQLLNQVSGMPDYFDVKGAETIFSSAPGGIEKVAAYAKGPLHFKPGTQWQYSNTNYYVLGRVIEIVSRRSYQAYVREQLFAPAGMSHSDFVSNESKLSDFATGYWRGPDQKGRTRPAPPILESWAGGAGAIVSTVGDVAAWDTALARGKIVTRDDYVLMSTPFRLSNGGSTAYGMGLGIDELDGHERVWHNGETNGAVAMNATYPRDDVAIIVVENSLGVDPKQIETAVFAAMFPDAAAAADKPAQSEDPAVRAHVLHLIDEMLRGSIPAGEMSAQFQKIATYDVQKHIAEQLAPLGTPKAVIFTGKGDRPAAVRYTYRVQFASRSMTLVFIIDKKTNLLDTMGIRKPE